MRAARALAWLGALLLAGCATYGRIENRPLAVATAAASGYGMRPQALGADRPDRITLVLSFSGGGARAAALAYGVLLELRATMLPGGGRLLDEVDAISAVSGGSFTAAYYGLRGEAAFHEFEPRFLRRDIEGDVLQRILNPLRWFTSEGRSTAAALQYDAQLFHGATFADLQRADGPLIIINATDLESGTRFAFLQESFDLLCSDLLRYPLASAVAASSAVPVVFEPMVLENHAGCTPPAPPAQARSPELQQAVAGLQGYADKQARRYIHLADGGLSDNLGLRAFQETVDLAGGIRPFLQRIGRAPNPHIVAIVVDASGHAAEGLGRSHRAPSLLRAVDIMSDVQLHRYNAATVEKMQESMQRWAGQLSTPERPVQPWLLDVALRDLPDPATRTRLSRITTGLALAPSEVDALVAAGRALLRDNPRFGELLQRLDAER